MSEKGLYIGGDVGLTATDKIAGEPPFCCWQGDVVEASRVCEGERMRMACSRGQLANGGGLGGAVHGRSGCGRRCAAKNLAAVTLQGARGRSEGRDTATPADQIDRGEGVNLGRGSTSTRTCKTRALTAPGARTVTARRNALVS